MSTDHDRQPTVGPHVELPTSRREFLARAGGGFGALALADLLSRSASERSLQAAEQTVGKVFPPQAKSVIFLFMEGGPSHIDLFDPKPELTRLAGQRLPESFGPIITAMGETDAPLLASQRKWQQHGQSGLWVSDWLPHTAGCADDLCVIRSCWADGLNHVGSVCQMNTGSVHAGRPSLGSWVMYGLGSENENLPGFVVLTDGKKLPHGGKRNWGTGFMPATYQGTHFGYGDQPIPNLQTPASVGQLRQRRKQDLLAELNQIHAAPRGHQTELEARIAAFELAFRMQSECPEAVDVSRETAATRAMYGLDNEKTAVTGRNCLLARRLVERGVRFVQIYCGAGSRWDAHTKLESNHGGLCQEIDQPIAALLTDLKQRGLLDETLIVWGGEFGRTPMSEKGDGRDHNPFGFTMWLAGGGVRGGQTIGTTDELGLRAVDDPVHVHDLHATILYALGIDHMQLIYTRGGRHENPTINDGRIVTDAFVS
ncbi:MAG: DUF1501 domain-containing protein [Planctomycetes bacterium]|nr:DUF1501 domain-containing protein [Planctomycetota bacterium]